jgi:hydroxyethylthiazole kinase-like uncharacterized protein yjeF
MKINAGAPNLMKVIKAKEMAQLEKVAYSAGASDLAFMEAAGLGVALETENYLKSYAKDVEQIILLCGKGNNAGDAYVAGSQLLQKGYRVTAWHLFPVEQSTPLCQRQYERFLSKGGHAKIISDKSDITIPQKTLFLDGILGTGFQGKLDGLLADVIVLVNQSHLPILSIDIPSGLNGNTGQVETVAIKARKTIFLGLPKTGFFIGKGWNHIGKLVPVDFGLPKDIIDTAHPDFYLLTDSFIRSLIPPIKRDRHKYEAGYVVALSGSSGMPGAAVLSGTACLRAGAGIVRLWHPSGMEKEMSGFTPELIHAYYTPDNLETLIHSFNGASAIFVGPGVGREQKTLQLLHSLFPILEKPCVVDADALTLLAEDPSLPFPKSCIVTPHKGEMDRLLKITAKGIPIDDDYFRLCQNFSDEKKLTLVLKGGPTLIFHPGSTPFINPRGDPGMATAGSGDVLTGIIAALLGQGLDTLQAAVLGTYLHGVAGEMAARDKTSYSLIASDLINTLPEAFKDLLAIHKSCPEVLYSLGRAQFFSFCMRRRYVKTASRGD